MNGVSHLGNTKASCLITVLLRALALNVSMKRMFSLLSAERFQPTREAIMTQTVPWKMETCIRLAVVLQTCDGCWNTVYSLLACPVDYVTAPLYQLMIRVLEVSAFVALRIVANTYKHCKNNLSINDSKPSSAYFAGSISSMTSDFCSLLFSSTRFGLVK